MLSNSAGVKVRLAVPADVPSIASVLQAAFAEYRHLYTAEGYEATTPGIEQIVARFEEGPMWVAVRGENVIGTVGAVGRGDALYVRGMAILPSMRGNGAGRSLMEAVERFARLRGYERLMLSTTPFLDSAIALYEKLGFKRSDLGPHDLHGTPLFTMAKRL
jgi:putative acetyltransferase